MDCLFKTLKRLYQKKDYFFIGMLPDCLKHGLVIPYQVESWGFMASQLSSKELTFWEDEQHSFLHHCSSKRIQCYNGDCWSGSQKSPFTLAWEYGPSSTYYDLDTFSDKKKRQRIDSFQEYYHHIKDKTACELWHVSKKKQIRHEPKTRDPEVGSEMCFLFPLWFLSSQYHHRTTRRGTTLSTWLAERLSNGKLRGIPWIHWYAEDYEGWKKNFKNSSSIEKSIHCSKNTKGALLPSSWMRCNWLLLSTLRNDRFNKQINSDYFLIHLSWV